MNAIDLLINLAALICALLILWRAEPALARMSPRTDWMIRYAMLLLAGGALAIVFAIVTGSQIDGRTLLILAGIALLLICERRLRHLVRPRQGGRHA